MGIFERKRAIGVKIHVILPFTFKLHLKMGQGTFSEQALR